MRERVKTNARDEEDALKRRARDLGFRLEPQRKPAGRWYIVSGHDSTTKIAASNLTLTDAAEFLFSRSHMSRS